MDGGNKLILGTAQFGMPYGINNASGQIKPEECEAILNLAFKNGIRSLDTALAYGSAHKIIGDYHRKYNSRFKILTKFKGSPKEFIKDIYTHLDTLKVESIHTLYFHAFTDFSSLKDLGPLQELKSSRLVKHLGVSAYTNLEASQALENDQIDAVQIPFNILDNIQRRGDILALAKTLGKKIHARSIFLQGLFFNTSAQIRELHPSLTSLSPYLDKIQLLCSETKEDLSALALNYPLHFDEISGVIFGIDSLSQLEKNIRMVGAPISKKLLRSISKIDVHDATLLNPAMWPKRQ